MPHRGRFPAPFEDISATFKSILWSGVFAAAAGSINLPDQQDCHDHWKIPCEAPQRNFRNACKATASRASARHENEKVGADRAAPACIPKLLARESAAEFFEIDEPLPGACPPSGHDRDLRIPPTLEQRGTLNRTEGIAAMAPGALIASALTSCVLGRRLFA